jgi:hypothetical protein
VYVVKEKTKLQIMLIWNLFLKNVNPTYENVVASHLNSFDFF